MEKLKGGGGRDSHMRHMDAHGSLVPGRLAETVGPGGAEFDSRLVPTWYPSQKRNGLRLFNLLKRLARPAGLEPATPRLGNRCFALLSYGRLRAVLLGPLLPQLLPQPPLGRGVCSLGGALRR